MFAKTDLLDEHLKQSQCHVELCFMDLQQDKKDIRNDICYLLLLLAALRYQKTGNHPLAHHISILPFSPTLYFIDNIGCALKKTDLMPTLVSRAKSCQTNMTYTVCGISFIIWNFFTSIFFDWHSLFSNNNVTVGQNYVITSHLVTWCQANNDVMLSIVTGQSDVRWHHCNIRARV